MMRMFMILSGIMLTVAVLFSAGCSDDPNKNQTGNRLSVSCGLPPAAGLIEMIGQDKVQIFCLLPEGRSPHDYAPSPRELQKAAKSRLYFSTGMSFEQQIGAALPERVKQIQLGQNIKRLEHSGCNHDHKNSDHHDHEGHDIEMEAGDPHLWLSCKNAIVLAGEICDALCAADPENEELYRNNLQTLITDFTELDTDLRSMLQPYAGRTFMVYHPAFGYFAADYSLHQLAVELSGRESSAAHLIEIIRQARNENIRVVFTQKQFNPAAAGTLAKEIDGTVQELDPLAADIRSNLLTIGQTLQKSWSQED